MKGQDGTPPAIDRCRRRWERARASLRLIDPGDELFSQGGLASRVRVLAVRVLVLPADPEASPIELDADCRDWWLTDRVDPFGTTHTRFGSSHRSTSSGIVQFDGDYDRDAYRPWQRYMALHRSAALEAGFSRDVAFERGGERYFSLIGIVGRVWSVLARYSEVVERYGCAGPFEVAVALPRTSHALLADFGEGWRDPLRDFDGPASRCLEPNILLRYECETWPESPEAIQAVAFTLGARIEDTWGSKERRYLARTGERSGEFDTSQYRAGL